MSFLSGAFLIASVAAAGPIIIHLLSRQRQVTIEWAPMDFLLRAVKRRRRRVQLRDLLLLLLRTMAILLFVLAMARPIWTRIANLADRDDPVHAIVALDNSLSMGHTTMDRTLLDAAKERVGRFLRLLPAGSDISLIPMCSQSDYRSSGVFDSQEDAIESLERIEVVDRMARLDTVVAAMRRAAEQPGTTTIKRFFVISDMQRTSWRESASVDELVGLGDIQLIEVDVAQSTDRGNSWVESFTLRDGYAEVGTPATFDATLGHEGSEPRTSVRAVLTVGDDVVAEQLVDLKPGAEKTISFEYTFPLPGGVVDPALVPVRVELENDALSADDSRYLIAPLFRRGPILFIDQYGTAESAQYDRLGETLPLRMLFSMRAAELGGSFRDEAPIHMSLAELRSEDLKKARVVVLAGIDAPNPQNVEMLRSFVARGGQLLIAAGADFNPGLWSLAGYNQGEGILPTALSVEMIGRRPRTPGDRTQTFRLDGDSLDRDVFNMDLSETQWDDLVAAPFFYQAVRIAPTMTTAEPEADEPAGDDNGQARVVGRYSNKEPFLLHRRIGRGNVLFLTTSLFPNWNNVAVEPKGAILLYDQMLRWLLKQSLAAHTFAERPELVVPVDRREQAGQFELLAPDGGAQPLAVEAVGRDDFALIVRNLDRRGIYTIRRSATDDNENVDAGRTFYTFALNGPSKESDLEAITQEDLTDEDDDIASDDTRPAAVPIIWIDPDEPISLLGGSLIGYDLWLYLLIAAMLCLALEMVIAAGPLPRGRETEVSS